MITRKGSVLIQFALAIGAWGVRRIILQQLLDGLLDLLLTSLEI